MTRNVEVGDVFKLQCNFPQGTKYKFLVLVKTKPNRFFMINSEINKYIHDTTERISCQVDIPHIDHTGVFTHDSFANCVDTVDTNSLIENSNILFNNLKDHRRGRLQDYVLSNIICVLENYNRTLKTKDNKAIVKAIKEITGVA